MTSLPSILGFLLFAAMLSAADPAVKIVSVTPSPQLANPNGRLIKMNQAARFRVVVENTTDKPQKGFLASEVVGNLSTVYGLTRESVELGPKQNKLLWVYWTYPMTTTFNAYVGPQTIEGATWGHEVNVAWLDADGRILDRGQAVFAIEKDGGAPEPKAGEKLTPKQQFDIRYGGYLKNDAFKKAPADADMKLDISGARVTDMKQGKAPSGHETYLVKIPPSPKSAKARVTFAQDTSRIAGMSLLSPDAKTGPATRRVCHLVDGPSFNFEVPAVDSESTLVIETYRAEQRKGDGGPEDTRSPFPISMIVERAEKKFAPFRNLLLDAGGKPITSPAQWSEQRKKVRETIWKALEIKPEPATTPLDPIVLSEEYIPQQAILGGVNRAHIRRKVSIQNRPGERMNVWLLIPPGIGPFPAIVVLHQTIEEGKDEALGLGGAYAQLDFATRLTNRGYVTVCPDSPTVGERWDPRTESPWDTTKYTQKDPSWSLIGQRLHDDMRAVDYMESLPFVDKTRMGSMGHSLGGERTMTLTAMDDRIAATVSSCGFWLMRNVDDAVGCWMTPTSRFLPESFRKPLSEPRKTRKLPFDYDDFGSLWAPRPVFVHEVNQEYVPEFTESMAQNMTQLKPLYKMLGAEDRLYAIMSNQQHCLPSWFQPDMFDWLDYWLNPQPKN